MRSHPPPDSMIVMLLVRGHIDPMSLQMEPREELVQQQESEMRNHHFH